MGSTKMSPPWDSSIPALDAMEPFALQAFYKANDLAGLRVTVQLRLLKYGLSVDVYLEPPTTRRYQRDVGIRPPFPKLGRQPGSPRLIVSNRAVFDRDFQVVDVTRADAAGKNSMTPVQSAFRRFHLQGRRRCADGDLR